MKKKISYNWNAPRSIKSTIIVIVIIQLNDLNGFHGIHPACNDKDR